MRKPNRTLLVLKYLWENTDDEHAVTLADITGYLNTQGIDVKNYRTIQGDIADLLDFGIDIIETRKSHYEYSIGDRHFEAPEVKLLIDAVQSSHFISQKKSKELIRKLSVFIGPHHANIINRQLYVERRPKANNESVMRSVDAVQEAIAARSKVTFQYFDYSPAKEKIVRHGGRYYSVSPYSMLWNGDNYYLVCHSDEKGIIQKFRIDRIDRLSQESVPRVEPPTDYDVSNYFSREFSMLSGDECDVELLIDNELMNNVIDRFGMDVKTEIVDDGHFLARVTVSLSPTFYGWVFSSQGKIQIAKPDEAIRGFRSMLDRYQ